MDVPEFMDLFIKELELNADLHQYYKLTTTNSRYHFRKAYIEQRLDYVLKHIPEIPSFIWDAGCGYATTSIFMALNGHSVHGSTLEYYYEDIQRRLDYWSQFGNLSLLTIRYENLYDIKQTSGTYDAIVLQDTLHHLESAQTAARIFYHVLKRRGKLLVVEENGRNVFIILRNLIIRGFKRTIEYHDKKLGKTIILGNENARRSGAWFDILQQAGFEGKRDEVEYIRCYPPWLVTKDNYYRIIQREQRIARNHKYIRQLFYFGTNFTMTKS